MSTTTRGENLHANTLNTERAEQMAKKYPDRKRKLLPDFDDLRIIDAAELLVGFCLEAPDEHNANDSVRRLRSGVAVATRALRGAGIERGNGNDTLEEDWISAIRVVKSSKNPFNASSGLEIRLPYMMDFSRSDWIRPHLSVQASYPYDGMSWIAHAVTKLRDPEDVTVSAELDLVNDTVKTLDDCMTIGRPGSDDEWIGFHLAPTLSEIASASLHD